MSFFFNVPIEFDRKIISDCFESAIRDNRKGYVCLMESNNLSEANLNPSFKSVVEGSLINLCDGSMIALILSLIYRKNLSPFTGSELFFKLIRSRSYSHYFLGNKQVILDGLKPVLVQIDEQIKHAEFVELPFREVDQFDYKSIADDINRAKPDLIWISLGAPKQELFMSNLLPYLDRGVLFGVGAAFNFYSLSSGVKRAPFWMRKGKIEWVYRMITEPMKSIPRYWRFIKILPKLINDELFKKSN